MTTQALRAPQPEDIRVRERECLSELKRELHEWPPTRAETFGRRTQPVMGWETFNSQLSEGK